MYNEILEYQKRDLQIAKILTDMGSTQYKKAMKENSDIVKQMRIETDKLGNQAKIQLKNFNQLKSNYETYEKLITELENNNLSEEEKGKKINELLGKLNQLQKNINITKDNVEKINKLYGDAKQKVISAKKLYDDAKKEQEKINDSNSGIIENLRNEMKELEKNIDSELLKKYHELKNENVLPVYVMLFNKDACGGCRQKLAANQIDKLKKEKSISCENCRRIIIDRD